MRNAALGGALAGLHDYAGKTASDRQRRVQVRAHAAVRGPRGAVEKLCRQGFTVLGFPCNQFGGQEPGTAAEIETSAPPPTVSPFRCSRRSRSTAKAATLYRADRAVPDADGEAGDIRNFEKFLIAPDGTIVKRFRPADRPSRTRSSSAIEANLPA